MHKLLLLVAAHNEEVWLRRQQRNLSRQCLEKIGDMPESLFIERFRLNKTTFYTLCEDLRCHTQLRGTADISLEIKVLCTLSFLATGSYQRIVGVTQHLPQRTASRCIRQVVEALNTDHMLKNIAFPQTIAERSHIRQEMQRRFNLPGVMGCIDCTHIAIIKPAKDEHLFFNQKGYHSLNIQMVCDHNLKILNINSKFGGATHDSFIWASSQVESYMRQLHQCGERTWLLGDSGYPQRPWLMTPVLNAAAGSREEMYTTRHIQAQNCIKRCFGLLKARWRCLLKHHTLHYHPHVASKIVSACCVLHNIAIQARLPPPLNMADQDDDDDNDDRLPASSTVPSTQTELLLGRATLNSLINRL